MSALITILKGFLIGIANIIPGISGGTMAVLVGIYEKLLNIISNLFVEIKKNLSFLFFLAIGLALSILLGSKIIDYSLANFPIVTVLLFMGLILGGIPYLKKKLTKQNFISSIITGIVCFLIVVGMCFIQTPTIDSQVKLEFSTFIILILLGFISAGAMIIPGISGSLILVILGYYNFLVSILSSLTDFSLIGRNLLVVATFAVGCIIGIFVFTLLIKQSMKRFPNQTNYGIFGFVLASLIAMPYKTLTEYTIKFEPIIILEIIIGLVLLVGGALFTKYLSSLEKDGSEEKENLTVN